MPAEPDSFVEETLWLREETQRLIDISRAERKMCDTLVAQYLAIFPRLHPWHGEGADLVPWKQSQ